MPEQAFRGGAMSARPVSVCLSPMSKCRSRETSRLRPAALFFAFGTLTVPGMRKR